MESDDFVDPYVDPETGVLWNLFNARTAEDLESLESIFVATRQIELEEHPISGELSLERFRAIHKLLVQDVYPWAERLRLSLGVGPVKPSPIERDLARRIEREEKERE